MNDTDTRLAKELQAMAAIGQVLNDLADAAARQRVLKWAAERFLVEGVPVPACLTRPEALAESFAGDPTLAVDSLTDMFASGVEDVDDGVGEFDSRATAAPDAAKLSLPAVLHSFATDFQRFVEQWNGATA